MNKKTALLTAILLLLPAVRSSAGEGGIVLRTPPSFIEVADHASILFRETAENAVAGGALLGMYLPEYIARQVKYGSLDAVTRQVLVCGLRDAGKKLTPKELELLEQSTENIFSGFDRIIKNRTDTPEQEISRRRTTLAASLAKGTPLLVDTVRVPGAVLYIWLMHYPMTGSGDRSWLTSAMATAIIPVRGTAVFVCASSILDRQGIELHLSWVKDSAAAFAATIVKNNK